MFSAKLSSASVTRFFSPLMAGVYHAPYPNSYRCPPGMTPDAWASYRRELGGAG